MSAAEKGHYEQKDSWNEEFAESAPDVKISPNFHSLQRRKSNAPLVPPKPKEFDMAYSISALRA